VCWLIYRHSFSVHGSRVTAGLYLNRLGLSQQFGLSSSSASLLTKARICARGNAVHSQSFGSPPDPAQCLLHPTST
jgi:hypothetical protein